MKNYSDITENLDITTKQYVDSGFMPKSGGTFTGNISVPQIITFTDTTNPYIKMTTGGTNFYFQSTNGQFGLGPTWGKATHWDANGNVTFPTTPKVGDSSLALISQIPTSSTVSNWGFTKNTGTVTSVAVKMNGEEKGKVTSSGTIDLGTVLTDASKFATSAQGTKADNAMPKSGGTFTGNISVPQIITFTDNTNPFIKMTTPNAEGAVDFYFQSTNGQFGLGPTWEKATHWDANGNVTFPTTPKVGDSSLALISQIPTSSTVSNWGFTKNTGTVTSVAVKMNGEEKGKVTSSGTIDLGTVITAHQDISGLMPKSGGTFTGNVTFASGQGHLKTDLIKSADDSKWIAEFTAAGLEIGGSGTPLRFYSSTRPIVANQNKELAYISDITAHSNTVATQTTLGHIKMYVEGDTLYLNT